MKTYQSHNAELVSKKNKQTHSQKFPLPRNCTRNGNPRACLRSVCDRERWFNTSENGGPDKNLEKEAARIISKLPKMTPGKQRGRAVRVPFSIPITFRLQ